METIYWKTRNDKCSYAFIQNGDICIGYFRNYSLFGIKRYRILACYNKNYIGKIYKSRDKAINLIEAEFNRYILSEDFKEKSKQVRVFLEAENDTLKRDILRCAIRDYRKTNGQATIALNRIFYECFNISFLNTYLSLVNLNNQNPYKEFKQILENEVEGAVVATLNEFIKYQNSIGNLYWNT